MSNVNTLIKTFADEAKIRPKSILSNTQTITAQVPTDADLRWVNVLRTILAVNEPAGGEIHKWYFRIDSSLQDAIVRCAQISTLFVNDFRPAPIELFETFKDMGLSVNNWAQMSRHFSKEYHCSIIERSILPYVFDCATMARSVIPQPLIMPQWDASQIVGRLGNKKQNVFYFVSRMNAALEHLLDPDSWPWDDTCELYVPRYCHSTGLFVRNRVLSALSFDRGFDEGNTKVVRELNTLFHDLVNSIDYHKETPQQNRIHELCSRDSDQLQAADVLVGYATLIMSNSPIDRLLRQFRKVYRNGHVLR